MHVTIKTIALRAGVSPAAVSRTLNNHSDIGEETKEKILKIAKELGYTPNAIARSLVKKMSNTIGLLIPDISTPIYAEIFKGLDAEAKRRGFNLFLCDTNRSKDFEKTYIRTLMENRARGIIVAPVASDVDHIIALAGGQVPLVFIGGKVNNSMDNYVNIDNRLGSKLAVDYLVSLGHVDIRMLCDNPSTKTKQDRVEGYRAAMEASGLAPKVYASEAEDHAGMDYGYAEGRRIFDSGARPSAIFASSDMTALGVMKAAAEFGIGIPNDLSLVGFDDIMFASLPTVMLTTVAQPKFQIGVLAIELLCRAIEEPDTKIPRRQTLEPTLVVRNTCKPVSKTEK